MSQKAWKTGYYYSKQSSHELLMIDEESKVWIVPIHLLDYPALLDYPEVKNTALGSFTFGDYGLARKEIQEALHDTTESTKYNLEMKLKYWDFLEINLKCVISEDGNTIHTFGIWSDLECYKWQSEDDLKNLAEDRDPALEPTCHYKIQPENQGKLVWLTGTPGSGKSTVGHLMSKEAGYVYLEGDCVDNYLNPFISPDLSENDATKNAFRQKPLKGLTRDCLSPHYGLESQAKYIEVQKKRIGGDFVVAKAIGSRKERDQIRKVFPECIFVILTITKEFQKKRLLTRHGEGKEGEGIVNMLNDWYKYFEPLEEDEKNIVNIDITEDMAPKDVMKSVLKILEKDKNAIVANPEISCWPRRKKWS